MLSSRNVELLLGYFVRCIRKAGISEVSEKQTESGALLDAAAEHEPEKLILELQPAERGLQSQILEADLILWTVGSKPQLPQLEPCEWPHELPLNARGQAETDETLRVKGHPRIFAVGDSSSLRDSKGKLLPATAQVPHLQFFFLPQVCDYMHIMDFINVLFPIVSEYIFSCPDCTLMVMTHFHVLLRLLFSKRTLLVGICGQQSMTVLYCHLGWKLKHFPQWYYIN